MRLDELGEEGGGGVMGEREEGVAIHEIKRNAECACA